MRTVLFTGLPGSGKSTTLLNLASFLKEKEDHHKSVAVVETEEGEKDVIRHLSGKPEFLTFDLTRGCIGCTSLTSGLCNALEVLQPEPRPSWLLIETSCLGFQTVKDTVGQSLPGEAQPYTVLVIESGGWASLLVEAPLLAEGLTVAANLILVNDFATLPPATLSTLASDISRMNPVCPVKVVRVTEMNPCEAFRPLLEPGTEIEAGAAA
ncbi:MAG: hypothetical protein LBG06_00815 [Deltaproteobacteria bacterium]|jgi:G3E family GTPase|nr:hypothetical protein [Deltaproteobacteria bacterium]